MAPILPDPGRPPLHVEDVLDLFTTRSARLTASLTVGLDVELFGLVDLDETDLDRQARLAAAADIAADDPDYYAPEPTDSPDAALAKAAPVVRIPAPQRRTAARTAVTA